MSAWNRLETVTPPEPDEKHMLLVCDGHLVAVYDCDEGRWVSTSDDYCEGRGEQLDTALHSYNAVWLLVPAPGGAL